jgi:hypothetical protein
MLHSFFGSNRSTVLILLLLPILVYAALAGMYLQTPVNEFGGPLYYWLAHHFIHQKWVLILFGTLVNVSTAYLLNSIINAHNFNQKENFYPALVFVLLCSLDLSWWYLNPVSLASLFLLLALRRLLRVYRIQEVTGKVFDSGFFMALAILVFPPFICVAPLIWFSLLQLRTFNFREWMVPISSLLIPFMYLLAYYWYTGTNFTLNRFALNLTHELPQFDVLMPTYFYGLAFSTLAISILGAYIFTADMRVSTVHKKNAKKVVIWTVFVLMIAAFYCYKIGTPIITFVWLLAIPAALACGDFFISTRRKTIVVTIFYIWIVAAFFYPLLTIFI